MKARLILLVAAILLLITGVASYVYWPKVVTQKLIPVEDFFRKPEASGFSLSPDGTKLAYLAPGEGRLNVFIRPVIGSAPPMQVTHATDRDIPGFTWKGNQRILYIRDNGGDENYRLYAVNDNGAEEKDLTPFENVRVRIIDDLEDEDAFILIGLNKRDPRYYDVYRLNIDTGEMQEIAQNPGNISGWMTDHGGNLRLASQVEGTTTTLLYREAETESFQPVLTTDFHDSVIPELFTFDNRYLYVLSNLERDKLALYQFDPRKKTFSEPLFEQAQVDVAGVGYSKLRKKLTMVSFITDRTHRYYFDEESRKLRESLEKRLPGVEVSIIDTSRDEKKLLIRTFTDRSLGAYYYFDRDTGKLTSLSKISPWLDESKMAEMKPVSYQARDGLTIHGYLTLPKGAEPKNLPLVVLPHGGPEARDYWGYDPEVQFLANRGIAVLQPNFRISTGYGKDFWQAGFKQWGKAMQDDLSDGVKWLVSQGIADPKRVGIYGASYGGYAALAGLTFTPDLYACGVSYVGPSNLFTLLSSLPPYWELGRKIAYATIGDPEKDKELLEAASPVFHAERIKVPLLVAQGANDPRVKSQESDQIVEALRKRNITVEYLLKEGEGHGFSNEENQFEFYRAMERFFGKCLLGEKG